jgi:HSP20 family protein
MPGTVPVKTDTAPAKPVTYPWEGTFGFPLFHRLSRELDAIFDRFGMEHPFFEPTVPTAWNPEMEVFTKNNEFWVKLDVPGMKKENITVEFEDDRLVLRGERKYEHEEKKEGYFKTERNYGSFYRSVPLPDGVDPAKAKAVLNEGVLTITMPVAAVETKARKLEIGEPTPEPVTKAA